MNNNIFIFRFIILVLGIVFVSCQDTDVLIQSQSDLIVQENGGNTLNIPSEVSLSEFSAEELELFELLGVVDISGVTSKLIEIEGDQVILRNKVTKMLSGFKSIEVVGVNQEGDKQNVRRIYDRVCFNKPCKDERRYWAIPIARFPLEIFIDPALGAGIIPDVLEGIDDWNGIDDAQDLQVTTNRNTADIIVVPNNLMGPYGRAEFPFPNFDQLQFEINVNASLRDIDAGSLDRLVLHELCHNLGFRHADFSESFAFYIPLHSTPEVDMQSVMVSGPAQTAGVTPPFVLNSRTIDDLRSIRMLYPSSRFPLDGVVARLSRQSKRAYANFSVDYNWERPSYGVRIDHISTCDSRNRCTNVPLLAQTKFSGRLEEGDDVRFLITNFYRSGTTYNYRITPLNFYQDFEGVPTFVSLTN